MDIPETGAIFTLGKSYLIENHQSYFFVKNDPVKKLISGPAQGAVICGTQFNGGEGKRKSSLGRLRKICQEFFEVLKSGRLFVWGENQFGQLGTPSSSTTGVLTKPTCVKSLKAIGAKVLDVAFGVGWSVMLTNENALYFSGKNIFPKESTASENFVTETVSGKEVLVAKKPFRLEVFDDILRDEDEHFCEIASGNEHFVALTTSGRLFGYGSNAFSQFGIPGDEKTSPVEIEIDAKIQSAACGPKSTIILTENEELFITGHLNEFQFPRFTELVHTFSDTKITCMQISQSNEIYLVTWDGDIYRSNEAVRTGNLLFQKFYDYPNEENGTVLKLLKGNAFYAALTRTKKLFTTFSESGHHLKTFREISKLRNLKILDFTVGDEHILVLGIPKSSRFGESRGVSGKTSFFPTYHGGTTGVNDVKNANILENGIKSEERDENKNKVSTEASSIKGVETAYSETKKPIENGYPEKIPEAEVIDVSETEKGENKSMQESEAQNNKGESAAAVNISQLPNNVGAEQNNIQSSEESQITQNGHIEELNEVKPNDDNSNSSEHRKNDKSYPIVPHADLEKPKSAISGKSSKSSQSTLSGSFNEPNKESNEKDEVSNLSNYAQQSSNKASSPATSVGSNKTVLSAVKVGSTPTTKADQSSNKESSPATSVGSNKTVLSQVKVDSSPTKKAEQSSNKGSSPAMSVGSSKTVLSAVKVGSTPTTKAGQSSNKASSPATSDMSNKTVLSQIRVDSIPTQEQTLPTALDSKDKPPGKQMTRNDSERSIKFDAKSIKSEKSGERIVRPQTPFPNHSVLDGNNHLTPLNGHYAPSNTDSASLNLVDSLENISDGVKEDPAMHGQHSNLDAQSMRNMAQQIPRTLPALKTPPNFSRRQLLMEDDPQDEDKLVIEYDVYDDVSETAVNEIRFINDGVDVTDRIEHDDDVKIHSFSGDFPEDEDVETVKDSKENGKEASSPAKDIKSATKKFIVTEAVIKPPSGKSTAKEQIKEAVHEPTPKNIEELKAPQIETSPNKHEILKKIPVTEEKFKRIVEDDERTTASAKSSNTGKRFGNDSADSEKDKASFTDVDLEKLSLKEEQQHDEADPVKPTRVKRFISDLKTKSRDISCRNSNSVHVEDDAPAPVAPGHTEQKTSKICTIL